MFIGIIVFGFIGLIVLGIIIGAIFIFKRRKDYSQIHVDTNELNHDHLFNNGLKRSMFSRGMCDTFDD